MKENRIEVDIKKCEEFINLSFLYGKLSFTKTQLYEYQKAMSKLITRYKQLEEENKSKQKAYDDCYCEYKHYKQFDSIPKSKVKEKIEELDRKITYIESQYTNGGQNCNSNYLSALYQKQILQELLEKRK